MNLKTEKRKHPRMNLRCPVKFRELFNGKTGEEAEFHAINLSQGGICLYLDKFISLSHRLILGVELPGRDEPVDVIARVIWEQETPVGMKIGAKFIDVDRKANQEISEAIE